MFCSLSAQSYVHKDSAVKPKVCQTCFICKRKPNRPNCLTLKTQPKEDETGVYGPKRKHT